MAKTSLPGFSMQASDPGRSRWALSVMLFAFLLATTVKWATDVNTCDAAQESASSTDVWQAMAIFCIAGVAGRIANQGASTSSSEG
eukprot:CAMPEP_0179014656 /NCGR_PEP_ID=MMETSP0796-20121207/2369_1 /TAXON_ID=73915 /ORGANISM="Pyrodinium bahamense, Strain pbaha01" /LENGTH=85 /DNA_ID=CAMNT_0020710227 /DNA_START=21 /DNA_END=278 /DNA_ORIENTATION=+